MTFSPQPPREVGLAEVLEGGHLLRLAAEGDPEPLVLAPEDVRDRARSHAPPLSHPGLLASGLRQRGHDRVETREHLGGDGRAIGHGDSVAPAYDTAPDRHHDGAPARGSAEYRALVDSTRRRFPVAVIGGGPAGLAVAAELGKAGLPRSSWSAAPAWPPAGAGTTTDFTCTRPAGSPACRV